MGVFGEGGSKDDVFDVLLGQAGLPFQQGNYDLRGEVIGSNSYKTSAFDPHGTANGIDDYAGSRHEDLLEGVGAAVV